jgi:hypothetical protein
MPGIPAAIGALASYSLPKTGFRPGLTKISFLAGDGTTAKKHRAERIAPSDPLADREKGGQTPASRYILRTI